MERIVDYYLAPQSPWAYLGHPRFVALLERHGVEGRARPIDLGSVFPLSGGLPLEKRAPQRQSYRLLDLARYAKRLGMPIHLEPTYFPVRGDAAARHIIAAAQLAGEAAAMQLTGAIQRAVWAEQRNIADAQTLDAIAAGCGLDAGALRAIAESPPVQARYDAYTVKANHEEVFGVPTFIPRYGPAKDQRFWGQDRLDLLADALEW